MLLKWSPSKRSRTKGSHMILNRKLLFILGANIASIWIVIGICSAAWLYRSRNEPPPPVRNAAHIVAPKATAQEDVAEPVGASLLAAARLWRQNRDPQALRQLLLTSERLASDDGRAPETAPTPPAEPLPAAEPSAPAAQAAPDVQPVLGEEPPQTTFTISVDLPTRAQDLTRGRLDRRWEDYQAMLKHLRSSMQLAGDQGWPMRPWTVAGS
ncbi:MAG TPA: hypothetical protein VK989_11725, partial [Polyangia bacterium]|nr:hypothetical protein [Polyangia bacterium]